MPPVPVPVPTDLLPALRFHVGASSQNAAKAKQTVEWFDHNFGGTWRAGHVTAKNQVYNRVPEQFKHQADNVVFIVSDANSLETLEQQVDRHAYAGLRNVLFVRCVGNNFHLERWLHWGTGPTASELAHFPGASPLLRRPLAPPGGTSGGPPVAPTGSPDMTVNWLNAEGVTDDPSGLVGSLGPFKQIVAALEAGKNVILMGPPGTGKTELAVAVCGILEVGRDIVTATSDWTTFDTIGGYLPDPGTSQPGGIEPLNFSPGCVTRALEGKRWVLIDELNRADIDKAFGELFTMLSNQIVRLPFKRRKAGGGIGDVVLGDGEQPSDEAIPVPEDWRMIGTMNTFDKASLYQMSFALMRRFAFVHINPPDRAAYSSLLTTRTAKLESVKGAPFRAECVKSMIALFCPPESATPPTLASLGLVVGPAIPLDIIVYIETRVQSDQAADAKTILREAVEMYLLPQFEGQDKKHKRIVQSIVAAIGLGQPDQDRLDGQLRIWTGYEPRKARP